MKRNIGIAGYGGIAAEELASWTEDDLDQRLGKLPNRCCPLVLAGSLCLNPFNQHNYPNDGLVMVDETTLPGEFRHQVCIILQIIDWHYSNTGAFTGYHSNTLLSRIPPINNYAYYILSRSMKSALLFNLCLQFIV